VREDKEPGLRRSGFRLAHRKIRSQGYGRGTVSIAKGSTVLRGTDTGWESLARAGLPHLSSSGRIKLEGSDEVYEVHLVNSDGLITLKRPFGGESVTNVSYTYTDDEAEFMDPVNAAPGEPKAAAAAEVAADSAMPAAPDKDRASSSFGEAARTIIYALAIALVIRAFLFQPFNIPSSSMVPTLLVGDYIFVSKFAYGFSRHSLPFSPPLFKGRIFGSLPERGDVVVFKLPSDGHTDYIKRVIGLPGDRIQVIDGVLNINGKPVPKVRVDDSVLRDSLGNVSRAPRYRETLPEGKGYFTLDMDPEGSYDNTEVYVVPEGHLFVMGDNRDNSLDSRATPDYKFPRSGGVGYVPLENLVGRAEIIFFSTDGTAHLWQFWRWPQATRFGRIFESVD
jgi:signal peptidase I